MHGFKLDVLWMERLGGLALKAACQSSDGFEVQFLSEKRTLQESGTG